MHSKKYMFIISCAHPVNLFNPRNRERWLVIWCKHSEYIWWKFSLYIYHMHMKCGFGILNRELSASWVKCGA